MLRKFLHGLAFGGGFAVALIAVLALYGSLMTQWLSSGTVTYRSRGDGRTEVESAPLRAVPLRFRGSVAAYTGEYPTERTHSLLAVGPGRIVGTVTSNGAPAAGVRLRLALNGSVLSAWATTDALGTYAVGVPFGRYRVDGYEIDLDAASAALPGKIDSPSRSPRFGSREFDVSQSVPGEGPNLAYVDAIVILGPSDDVSLRDPIVVRWEPYAGAASYRVQLYEAPSAEEFATDNVFDIRQRPTVTETSFDVKNSGAMLKSGSFYTIEIQALDLGGDVLAESGRGIDTVSFGVVD